MITGSVYLLRRFTNEMTSGSFSHEYLETILELNGSDLYASAAMVWDEKASALEGLFDHSSDGERVEITQKREFAERMAQKYASKRSARTSLWVKAPDEEGDEEDDLQ
jgi:hypothetical protein